MDDRLLASRAGSGDLDSFGQLYDRYFHRVYDFAYRVLRDADAAADVTRNTFTRASASVPSLAKSGNVAASIFSIARQDALDRGPTLNRSAMRSATHEEAFGTFAAPDPSRIDRAEMVGGDFELGTLVWEALSALNAPDYSLLDLHDRQGLDSADLARILNVNKRDAATIVSRMKTAATGVVLAYIVARRGASDCPELQRVLAPFTLPPYNDSIRRAVDRHIADCRICQRTRDGVGIEPLAVLGAFAAVGAPMSLKSDIWRELSAGWGMTLAGTAASAERMPSPYGAPAAVGAVAASAAAVPPWDPGGSFSSGGGVGGVRTGPTAIGGEWDRNRILWFAGGAVVLLVLAFGAAAAVRAALDNGTGGGSGGPVSTRTAGPTRTPTPGGTPAGVGVTTPTAAPTASPTTGPTETATVPPPPTALPTTATPVPQNTPVPRVTPTTGPVRTATPKPGKPTATATKCPGACPTATP